MLHLRLTSNGSSAFVFIEVGVYGNYVEHMCPIDYPDTDFECHKVSKTYYLIVKLGNDTELMDISGLVRKLPTGSKRQTTLYSSFAPFGRGWFLINNQTAWEYHPVQNSFGSPVNVSAVTAWTLANLWRVMSVPPEVSNGSLVFTFPYNSTYRVPLDLFKPYLEPLAFSAFKGMSELEFLAHLRAVPFKRGLLIYLPTYGVSFLRNGSLVVENPLNPYVPYKWVYYRAGEFPWHLFPPVFYYENGHLRPILRIIPNRNGLTLDVSKTVPLRISGSSSAPRVNVPQKTLYIGGLEIDTDYPPTNVTFVRVLVISPSLGRRRLLGEIVNGRYLIYLNMPFEGQFYYSQNHWFYRCTSCSPEVYYLYDWRNHTLVEGNFSPDAKTMDGVPPSLWNATRIELMFNDRLVDLYLTPLANFSECLPPSRAVALKMKEMGIGKGVLLYFPHYATGISLSGKEWAVVSGTGDDVGVMVSGMLPCPFFYYADGRVKFRMRVTLANATIPVGNWRLTLSYPYINTAPTVNVSVVPLGKVGYVKENRTSSTSPKKESSICGPGTLLLVAISVLIPRKTGGENRRGIVLLNFISF